MCVGFEMLDGCGEGVLCKYLGVPKGGTVCYMHWLGAVVHGGNPK